MFRFVLSAAALLATGASPSAFAGQPDRAGTASYPARAHEVALEVYGQTREVVRARTEGATYAVFEAGPMAIHEDTLLVFEVVSRSAKGAIPRWRCVAVEDASECLGEARRFRWVVGDDEMVLSMTPEYRHGPRGDALFAEAMAQQAGERFAGRD